MNAADVTALVTCHNEAPARSLLQRVLAELPRVLVVDDALPSARAAALDELAGTLGVEVLHLDRRSGKGHAVAAGVRHLIAGTGTGTGGVLVLDGDGQHPPERIPAFLTAAASADLVIGDRFADPPEAMPRVRWVANRIATSVIARATDHEIRDSQCGMRLLCGRALHEVPFPVGGYEAETHHLRSCLAAGIAPAWVPIPAIYDGEHSSFRPLRDSARVLRAAAAAPARDGHPAQGRRQSTGSPP